MPLHYPEQNYQVYILECADGTLYTGCTTDMDRRLSEHNGSDKGAAYTRNRRPVKLLYTEMCGKQGDAQKREYDIKQLTRTQKLALIEEQQKSE